MLATTVPLDTIIAVMFPYLAFGNGGHITNRTDMHLQFGALTRPLVLRTCNVRHIDPCGASPPDNILLDKESVCRANPGHASKVNPVSVRLSGSQVSGIFQVGYARYCRKVHYLVRRKA